MAANIFQGRAVVFTQTVTTWSGSAEARTSAQWMMITNFRPDTWLSVWRRFLATRKQYGLSANFCQIRNTGTNHQNVLDSCIRVVFQFRHQIRMIVGQSPTVLPFIHEKFSIAGCGSRNLSNSALLIWNLAAGYIFLGIGFGKSLRLTSCITTIRKIDR